MQAAQAAKRNEIKIGYIKQAVQSTLLPASRLDSEPDDDGIAGAETALKEDNAAGQFTGDLYTIERVDVRTGDDPKVALGELLAENVHYIIVDAPAKTLLSLSDAAKGKEVVLFNIRDEENALREQDCRANILHVAPSHAMLADALAQYLVNRKWTNWLLVSGPTGADTDYADSVKRAADRFGATIVGERQYRESPGEDRNAIGTIPPASEPSAGSANAAPSYDVVVVADEEQEWGPYAPYRGGADRPVVGTAGLMAKSWSPAHAIWGARQLNMHFEEDHHRYMTSLDYHGYIAARTVGEAVTRNHGAKFAAIDAFMKSPRFQLNAFKGIRHTYRPWDNQFRQPLLIATDRVVVSIAPEPGFKDKQHPDEDIVDTLGFDKGQTPCNLGG